jgi:hypothetical protein
MITTSPSATVWGFSASINRGGTTSAISGSDPAKNNKINIIIKASKT